MPTFRSCRISCDYGADGFRLAVSYYILYCSLRTPFEMRAMQSWFRIPFVFFFIAACIGLLLRWHFVSPLDWLQFPYWLHAHSHIMFLGWIFNTLFLAYVSNYSLSKRRYGTLFIIIQV